MRRVQFILRRVSPVRALMRRMRFVRLLSVIVPKFNVLRTMETGRSIETGRALKKLA
jgi:hypothetical protein